jgi:hypothetical protein
LVVLCIFRIPIPRSSVRVSRILCSSIWTYSPHSRS